MRDDVPTGPRPGMQWQIVLVNPRLLKAAQRRLGASGPSHAIEQALKFVLSQERRSRPAPRLAQPAH
jgi:hypothetical protein